MRVAILLAVSTTAVACSEQVEPEPEPDAAVRAFSSALGLTSDEIDGAGWVPMSNHDAADMNDVVFSSPLGTMIFDGFAQIMTDPTWALSAQGAVPMPPPTAPKIGGVAIPGTSQQGGGGGIEMTFEPIFGFPSGPFSSVSEFANLVCDLAINGCTKFLACMPGASFECSEVFSQSRCRAHFESAMVNRGITQAPFALINVLRCGGNYVKTARCSDNIVQDMVNACSPR